MHKAIRFINRDKIFEIFEFQNYLCHSHAVRLSVMQLSKILMSFAF